MTSLRAKGAALVAALAAWAGLGCGLGGPTARAADFSDPDVGVHFPVPFQNAEHKTGSQVKALVLDHPDVTLPDGARFAGALYAPSGVPFIVVWTRHDRSPPSRALLSKLDALGQDGLRSLYGLDSLSIDPGTLRGVGEVTLTGHLHGKVLVQVAKGETIGVGYYDAETADLKKPFDELAAGFELAPEKRLTWEDLPHGGWYWARVGAAGAAFTAAAAACALWFERSKGARGRSPLDKT